MTTFYLVRLLSCSNNTSSTFYTVTYTSTLVLRLLERQQVMAVLDWYNTLSFWDQSATHVAMSQRRRILWCQGGAADTSIAIGVGGWKYGIVRILSGAGPCTSSLRRPLSLYKPVFEIQKSQKKHNSGVRLQQLTSRVRDPRGGSKLCTGHYWTYSHNVCMSLWSIEESVACHVGKQTWWRGKESATYAASSASPGPRPSLRTPRRSE
jgi:hypothetical protein